MDKLVRAIQGNFEMFAHRYGEESLAAAEPLLKDHLLRCDPMNIGELGINYRYEAEVLDILTRLARSEIGSPEDVTDIILAVQAKAESMSQLGGYSYRIGTREDHAEVAETIFRLLQEGGRPPPSASTPPPPTVLPGA